MTHQNNQSHPFWSGFVVGSLVGTGLMYLLGTKKGRETVEHVLDNTENFEYSVQAILKFLQETDLISTATETAQEKKEDIATVMDKMKSVLYNKDDVKNK